MKVLFVNNYNMENMLRSWRCGDDGRHHLWGITEFPRLGLDVEILPFSRYGALKRWRGAARWGDLDQEMRAFARRRFDVLYAGSPGAIGGLAFLRGLRLWDKPIVSILHHALPAGRQPAVCVRGLDRIVCLSRWVADRVARAFPGAADRVRRLDWGPDTRFLRPAPPGGDLLVSAGKTLRDYDTLCAALARVRVPARIFCSEDSAPRRPPPAWVEVVRGGRSLNPISCHDLAAWYGRAFAVAVPLQKHDMLIGLTSLLDAMAVAQPVLITRNACLDIDVEAEGCGLWVEPGDVEGWVRALRFVLDHPREAAEMGRRGRRLCEARYNIDRFARDVTDVIRSAAGRL